MVQLYEFLKAYSLRNVSLLDVVVLVVSDEAPDDSFSRKLSRHLSKWQPSSTVWMPANAQQLMVLHPPMFDTTGDKMYFSSLLCSIRTPKQTRSICTLKPANCWISPSTRFTSPLKLHLLNPLVPGALTTAAGQLLKSC